jgi:predicted nucleic-acid-binding protein
VIGLDTNVLVRYLVQDDPRQARQAAAAIDGAAGRGERLHLAALTLCELVWVLESSYDEPRVRVAAVLDHILRTVDFELEHRDLVRHAADIYRETAVDFADALVAHVNHAAGCDYTLTFDKSLRRLAHVKTM